ncbi:MAG: DUF4416 family protein [bacterium]
MKLKLFTGLLYNDINYRNNAVAQLVDIFGDIENYSDTLNFSAFSGYYDSELGGEVTREWLLFKNPPDPENFYEKKIMTNNLEDTFRRHSNRMVNIDPGIVTVSNVQLLTTKNYSHRIYMGEGIFAEVTFMFKKNGFDYLRWTYPDYKTQEAQSFFLSARKTILTGGTEG